MANTITTTEPADEPSEPASPTRVGRHNAARAAWFAAWAVVALLVWVTCSRVLGITFPSKITVPLQAMVPIVFLPLYPIGVVAVVRKEWVLAAACLGLAVVHVASVYPALGHRALPAWAATAPRLTILEANVYDHNAEPSAAAGKILTSGADVLVLVELDTRTVQALRGQGIDDVYPYSTLSRTGFRSDVIWSKRPLEDVHPASFRNGTPWATVVVDDRRLLVVGVHVENALRSRSDWNGELQALKGQAAGAAGPLAMVGDFNSTRWNPPFGELLDSGLHDAHESVGQGLSRSWPNLGALSLPLMRLDHALVNDQVGVVSVRDVDIPGSDHIGLVAELAVGS